MDVSQYLEIFIDESNEHLQSLSDQLMILEKEPENSDTINEIFRATLLKVWQELWAIRECRISHMIWKMYSQK